MFQATLKPGAVSCIVWPDNRCFQAEISVKALLFQMIKKLCEVEMAFAWVQVAPVAVGAILLTIVIFQMNMPYQAGRPEPGSFQGQLNLVVDSQKLGIKGHFAATIA